MQCMDPLVGVHWFSCSELYGISIPWPRMEPTSPALQGRFLTTGPPGKSLSSIFLIFAVLVDEKSSIFYLKSGKFEYRSKLTALLVAYSLLTFVSCVVFDCRLRSTLHGVGLDLLLPTYASCLPCPQPQLCRTVSIPNHPAPKTLTGAPRGCVILPSDSQKAVGRTWQLRVFSGARSGFKSQQRLM